MNEVAKIKLLTPEEEIELARRIHKGDLDARNRLVAANLKFVISVSKQYQNLGLSLADMINEGNLGLIKAAERFDETRGFKFISYAVWWIRQSILQALANQARIVHLPLNRYGHMNKLKKVINILEQRLEREPTILEISQVLELDPADVEEAIKNTGWYMSMDITLKEGEDEGNFYDVLLNSDTISPDKELMTESLCKEIESILSTLTYREASIIEFYFGLNGKHKHTLEEISEEFNLTSERIRQIKDKTIMRLKHIAKSRILKTYLT